MKKPKIKYRSLQQIAADGRKKAVDYSDPTSLRKRILDRLVKY